MIFISHKLHEVMSVSDRVTVLRGGRSTANVPAAGRHAVAAALMVGRELGRGGEARGRAAGEPGAPASRACTAKATAATLPSERFHC